MNIILLSGGSGKRLWPISNEVRSKQFLKILKGDDGTYESMVQRMYRMIKAVDPDVNITFATSEDQVDSIHAQLGYDVDISIEPCRRDTFPAIALAVSYLYDKKGLKEEEPVVVCPVDPFVDEGYFKALVKLSDLAASGISNLSLLGIEPSYPSSKYGYIMIDKEQNADKGAAMKVAGFKEKPTEEVAAGYIEKGALWNGGIFAFKLGYLLKKTKELLGTSEYQKLFEGYENVKKISFDYAVVEKEESITALRFSGEWRDLGTWNTLTEAMADHVTGNAVADYCENTHVINELQIPLVALGCKNMAIAATPDGILIIDKALDSQLKEYVADARPMSERKQWGEYQVVDYQTGSDEQSSLTKRLIINAGHHISYQLHRHRSETWTVTEGEGTVILDGERKKVSRGSTIYIAPGMKHSVIADTEMHIIEVQIGDDLTESDIERIEFDWGSI